MAFMLSTESQQTFVEEISRIHKWSGDVYVSTVASAQLSQRVVLIFGLNSHIQFRSRRGA